MDGSVKITVMAGSVKQEVEVTGLQDTSDKLKIIREVLNTTKITSTPARKTHENE